jgi:hypothetical protein
MSADQYDIWLCGRQVQLTSFSSVTPSRSCSNSLQSEQHACIFRLLSSSLHASIITHDAKTSCLLCASIMSINLKQLLVFVSSAASGCDPGGTAGPIGQSVQALCFNEVEHLIDLRCLKFDEVELSCRVPARDYFLASCLIRRMQSACLLTYRLHGHWLLIMRGRPPVRSTPA